MTELDFAAPSEQKQDVVGLRASFYAEWRVRCGASPLLREDRDSPPERLLQAVWLHQRLRRDQLHTVDGQAVRVLHPGFHNLEGGPDFRGAVIQLGQDRPQNGDIEVDLRSSGWRAHGHDRNPSFEKVILRVVWESERSELEGRPPLLVLRQTLDAPLGELSLWLGSEASSVWPENLRGKCCAPLRELSGNPLQELLREAAHVRLQSKAAQFQARARQAGWDQSLWEGMFRALGYKHNVWPMQCVAELRSRWTDPEPNAIALQARLLGISGLLPLELTRSHSDGDGYLRCVWDQWWRERDKFTDCVLPKELWRFHGLRPANHPQRRLALASHWALQGQLAGKLEKWCAASIPDKALGSSLSDILQVEPDEFWSWHCTIRSARFKRAQPLLGGTRATDLAVNVVLPWLWIRAVEGKNESMQQLIERRYFAWPPAQDNAVLRLARQRLLGGASSRLLDRAATQQGLLQIVRDFCQHSNSICENCKFPELVREFAGQR